MPPQAPVAYRLLDYSGRAKAEKYTAKSGGGSDSNIVPRQRAAHAGKLRGDLQSVKSAAERIQLSQELAAYEEDAGIHIEIRGKSGCELLLEPLDAPRFGISLENVRVEQSVLPGRANETTMIATVFVKHGKLEYLVKRVEAYSAAKTRTDKTGKVSKMDFAPFITSIESIGIAAVEAFWTSRHPLPDFDVETWWELWVRAGTSIAERNRHEEAVLSEANRLGLQRKQGKLILPEHSVFLFKTTRRVLSAATALLNFISELRYPALTPAFFIEETPVDQHQWSSDLKKRLLLPLIDAPAVCILDTGVNRGHPLLEQLLLEDDHDTVREEWGKDDHHAGGHGTAMAGLAAYGDLTPLLEAADRITLTHRLESVKILPRFGANEPENYGPLTQEAIARAEINAPMRPRVFTLAVTATDAEDYRENGKPSSWSAALDSMTSGALESEGSRGRRLVCVSGGNVWFDHPSQYPNRNELTSIEDPAQSWNAVTVGAYTDKNTVTDADGNILNDQTPIAARGGLCPSSATSCLWTGSDSSNWPIKPDVVFEGGNQAADSTGFVSKFDSLSLLTTSAAIQNRLFAPFGETSAATALAARTAAIIQAAYPKLWPETIRALLVHSAEWTSEMTRGAQLGTKAHVAHILRRFGHGIPNATRALNCAKTRATLLCQDSLQPFVKDGGKAVSTKDMMLYRLPWPKSVLQENGAAEVRLRVTLSYFIEPNPGSRSGNNKYRYASCGLRFQVQTPTEKMKNFMARVSDAVSEAEKHAYQKPDDTTDGWLIGDDLRRRGSLHSDIWTGSAAKLAQMEHLIVYPVNGWWRLRPQHQRYKERIRYALIVTLETAGADIDLYSPISVSVANSIST